MVFSLYIVIAVTVSAAVGAFRTVSRASRRVARSDREALRYE